MKAVIEMDKCSSGFAPDDRIFLGEGLFETIAVEDSQPKYAQLHWKRLFDCAQFLGIPFGLTLDEWTEALAQAIARDGLIQGGLKVILSGGVAPRGLIHHGTQSKLLFQTFLFTKNNNPLKLQSTSWLRDAKNPVYRIKSINYLESIIARRNAAKHGFDDVLFYNTDIHVTETSCSNLFLIKNNELYTPALSDGVLPGVTRSRVVLGCSSVGIMCNEVSLGRTQIKVADAIFLSNALQGIQRVSCIDTYRFNVDNPLLNLVEEVLRTPR